MKPMKRNYWEQVWQRPHNKGFTDSSPSSWYLPIPRFPGCDQSQVFRAAEESAYKAYGKAGIDTDDLRKWTVCFQSYYIPAVYKKAFHVILIRSEIKLLEREFKEVEQLALDSIMIGNRAGISRQI